MIQLTDGALLALTYDHIPAIKQALRRKFHHARNGHRIEAFARSAGFYTYNAMLARLDALKDGQTFETSYSADLCSNWIDRLERQKTEAEGI